jgi:diguanylate cyclase (GGDEF)-like protein
VFAPVTAAGAAALAAALWAIGDGSLTARAWAGIALLAVASTLSEAFPVPVAAFPAGNISLAAVFVVGVAVLFGWAPAVVVAFFARAAVELTQRRPVSRLLYNGALYALSGLAAGGGAAVAHGAGVGSLFLGVGLSAAGFCVVNVPLVAAIVSRWAREPFAPMLREWIGWTAVSFAVMASTSLMLAALWERSPLLAAPLVGPLAAIALYQRSTHRALNAMRLALTDPLTGLGNHRRFHDQLQRELDAAAETGLPLSLCLLDLDNFKEINDTFGHPTGDDVLGRVAACLGQGGEAFRLGGDEFALLLAGRGETEARVVAETVLARLAAMEGPNGVRVTFSAGLAAFPLHALERTELLRVADVALYTAKRAGKNQLRVAEPGTPLLAAVATS